MPTYQYICTDCGHELEVVQRFTDDALAECPVCNGRLRKVFYPVGVVFKGSGFYRNDSRKPAKEPAAAGSSNGAAKDSAGSKAESSTTTPSASSDAGPKPKKSAPTKATSTSAA